MKKSIYIVMPMVMVLCGLLSACAPVEPSVDPVALTVAAIDINETFQWIDLNRTQTAQVQVTEAPPVTRAYDFNLNTANTIAETVVYDSGNIKIAVLSLQYGGVYGPALVLLIENASPTAICVQANEVVVNDYMLKSTMEASIASGQSSLEMLNLSGETLERSGIVDIQSIAFSLRVTDTDSWSHSITTERIHVQSSADPDAAHNQVDMGKVLVEREGVRIAIKKLNGERVLACIENNTDTDLAIQAKDVKVNGMAVVYRYQEELLAGTKSIQELVLDAGDLMSQGINTIQSLELRLIVTRKSDEKPIFETESVLLKFD